MSRINHPEKQSVPAFCCRIVLSAASALALSACGNNTGGAVTTSNTNTPTTTVTTGEAIAPIDTSKIATAAATGDGVKTAETVKPVETLAPIPTPMETFRSLAPEQGLKITPLFNTPVADESARIARVENAVQGMKNDFDTIMPTMVRMASMEKDMRGLIDKLHVLTGDVPPEQTEVHDNPNEAEGEPMSLTQDLVDPLARKSADDVDWTLVDDVTEQPPAKTSVTKTVAATTAKKAAIKASKEPEIDDVIDSVVHDNTGVPAIKGIRIADHSDSTRIVLDLSTKASVPPASFQNDGKQLVLDLPQIDWGAKTEAAIKNSALVSGYKYEGGKLTLTLTKASQVKSQQALPPEGASGYRLVLDLQPKV